MHGPLNIKNKLIFECAPDDGWGYHPKHVELSAENKIKLYLVVSCWTIIDIFVLFKMFFVTGLKAHNGLLSVGGNVKR